MSDHDAATPVLHHLGPGDLPMLLAVAPGLFDHTIAPDQARAFLESPLNRLVIATLAGQAVAFASATVLLHPDKPPALFVNELGTREAFQRREMGRAVLMAMIERARAEGCKGIWLGTEMDNAPARALYLSAGGQETVFSGYGWDGAFDD